MSQTGIPCRPRLRAIAVLTCAPPTINAPGGDAKSPRRSAGVAGARVLMKFMDAHARRQSDIGGAFAKGVVPAIGGLRPPSTQRRAGDAPRRKSGAGDEAQQRPKARLPPRRRRNAARARSIQVAVQDGVPAVSRDLLPKLRRSMVILSTSIW